MSRSCPGIRPAGGGRASPLGKARTETLAAAGRAPHGTDVIVLAAKGIEDHLLSLVGLTWRSRGLLLEGAMHALVATILLRVRRLGTQMADPQPQPPDRELRQACQAAGGEGSAVVGEDGFGQAVRLEQFEEYRSASTKGLPGCSCLRRRRTL